MKKLVSFVADKIRRVCDLGWERVHKREDARAFLGRFLDHDADAETHKRLAEVDDALTSWCYSQRSNRQVRLLFTTRDNIKYNSSSSS